MAKDATVKDVLYALEYLGEALIRSNPNGGKAKWSLRGGMPVKDKTAQEVCASGFVVSMEDHGRAIVTWRRAA